MLIISRRTATSWALLTMVVRCGFNSVAHPIERQDLPKSIRWSSIVNLKLMEDTAWGLTSSLLAVCALHSFRLQLKILSSFGSRIVLLCSRFLPRQILVARWSLIGPMTNFNYNICQGKFKTCVNELFFGILFSNSISPGIWDSVPHSSHELFYLKASSWINFLNIIWKSENF